MLAEGGISLGLQAGNSFAVIAARPVQVPTDLDVERGRRVTAGPRGSRSAAPPRQNYRICAVHPRPALNTAADHIGGYARGYQELSAPLANPDYGRAGRRPSRMFQPVA